MYYETGLQILQCAYTGSDCSAQDQIAISTLKRQEITSGQVPPWLIASSVLGQVNSNSMYDRVCLLCNQNLLQSKLHFLFVCEKLGDIHQKYFSIYLSYDLTFHDMEKKENFLLIMTTHPETSGFY